MEAMVFFSITYISSSVCFFLFSAVLLILNYNLKFTPSELPRELLLFLWRLRGKSLKGKTVGHCIFPTFVCVEGIQISCAIGKKIGWESQKGIGVLWPRWELVTVSKEKPEDNIAASGISLWTKDPGRFPLKPPTSHWRNNGHFVTGPGLISGGSGNASTESIHRTRKQEVVLPPTLVAIAYGSLNLELIP